MPDEGKPVQLAAILVGIGASAGGVEALSLFFDHERGESHAAFLVVRHLSSGRKSHLADILSRHTGMPVLEAENGMPIEANTVYVMPPGMVMTVARGLLRLDTASITEHAPSTVDRFFNSLAEQCGDHARLIEQQLSYELGGASELEFAPGGLKVKLHVPRLEKKETIA